MPAAPARAGSSRARSARPRPPGYGSDGAATVERAARPRSPGRADPTDLRRLFAEGRDRNPGLRVGFGAFARAAFARGLGRMEAPAADESAIPGDLYLVAACEAAVPGAWEALYRRHLPALRTRAAALTRCGALADELAGEVLADLCLPLASAVGRRRLSCWSGRGALSSWLAVILRRALIRRRRAHVPVRLDPARDGLDDAAEGPEAAVEAREELRAWRDVVARNARDLTPRELSVLRLKYVEERSQREIARDLEVGEPRVSRIHGRALARLAGRPWRE